MFQIYSFIYTIVVLVLFIPEYVKRHKDLRGKWLREKLGYLPEMDSAIWVHAVSVGEVNASIPLLEKLRSTYPDFPIILSTITDTGHKVGMLRAPEGVNVVYLPFDVGLILNRCFRNVGLRIFIVIETELWPNALRSAARNKAPVLVLNGRISEKSSLGYQKISFFMKKVFSFVSKFGMQGRADAERIRKIGAEEDKISIMGNLKFDMKIPDSIPAWTHEVTGQVIVAGSTHRGEEEIIVSAFMECVVKFPDLKLILAPRHPDRFREVEDMLRSKGISFVKRSGFNPHHAALAHLNMNVILLDSVGELSSVYGIADIAIMGKSFKGVGGQSPLEPAYWGKAILCGPHMENFPFMKDFYDEGAAFEAEGASLSRKILELLSDPEKAKTAGKKANEIYRKNSGAVERAMKLIGEFINL